MRIRTTLVAYVGLRVNFTENVSCLINTTNCCSLLTPAASMDGGKTIGTINLFLYGFLLICLNIYSKF